MPPYDMADMTSSYSAPDSMESLTSVYRAGMIPLAVCAMMSLISVAALLGFITQRMISWRKHYRQYVGYNQYVILIFNLLIADLQQSIAFSISFHWLRINKIVAPTGACFIQAWFLQIGDVASGFFVLAIGIHTWLGVVKGYKLPYVWFVVAILSIWFFALFLTVLGPAMHQERYFARAAAWCWVSSEFQEERLWLHYLWIFIVEFGTIIIYAHIFFHLRGRIRSIIANDTSKLTRANKFMVMYPAVYVVLTLPLAVGRMVAMTGGSMPDSFYIITGCLLTSCGWVDALLYTLTRRVLVSGDLSTGQYNRTVTANLTNAVRPGDDEEGHYGLRSVSKNDRTVTITGGSQRSSHLSDNRRGRTHMTESQHQHGSIIYEEECFTRTGSQDSIIVSRPKGTGISIVTETSVHVRVETAEEKETDAGIPLTEHWSHEG
ncbi:integral membrane [Pyrenophora seminiperda CCB06]|uniref:Integral membrane n=1 Tax=Pyrenophora seminiperda CCB06 TaxID=1302712 RepID=A0A3M7MCE5_9PLEO|nr:integral membrane [Pyrenophora seminiperda CCB06]